MYLTQIRYLKYSGIDLAKLAHHIDEDLIADKARVSMCIIQYPSTCAQVRISALRWWQTQWNGWNQALGRESSGRDSRLSASQTLWQQWYKFSDSNISLTHASRQYSHHEGLFGPGPMFFFLGIRRQQGFYLDWVSCRSGFTFLPFLKILPFLEVRW